MKEDKQLQPCPPTHGRKWTSIKDYEDIHFEFSEGISKITIDRPRWRNAFRPTSSVRSLR